MVNILTWNKPLGQAGLGTGLLGQSSSARMASSPPSSGLLWDTGVAMATAAKMAGRTMEKRMMAGCVVVRYMRLILLVTPLRDYSKVSVGDELVWLGYDKVVDLLARRNVKEVRKG